MSPEEFFKELSKYELFVYKRRNRKRDPAAVVIGGVGLALGLYLIFMSDSSDYDTIAGSILFGSVSVGFLVSAFGGGTPDRRNETGSSGDTAQSEGTAQSESDKDTEGDSNESSGTESTTDQVSMGGTGGGGDPNDRGSDTTVIIIRPKKDDK